VLELSGSIRDGRPLNTQHFGEKALGDQQRVLVTAITHHEQQRASRSLRLCAPLHATDTRTFPAAYALRDFVVAGGLMSYGTDIADRFR
jgi:hypothetical protein